MNNSALKELLKEYDTKRLKAEEDLASRKAELYHSIPRLQEIESELNKTAIGTAKSILISGNSEQINILKEKIEILNKERDSLLSKIGKDESYLKPHYECSICNDTGYIRKGSTTIMCNCLKQALFDLEFNKSNISNLKNQDFKHFNINYYSSKINEEKYKSDIFPRENIKIITDIANSFIVNFDDPEEKNLLFTGNTGLGKTFLTNCIANEILKKKKTVLYQTAPVMLDEIINAKFGKNSMDNIYNNILDVDLLIIDDLGTECMNSMKFSELFTIINTRILCNGNKVTKTIISTNLNLQNLFSMYDERIISRIVGHYNICRFFGDDIRFIKNKKL